MPIPVIDFSKLNGEERSTALAEIAKACEEWGFFQLVNHGITDELLEKVKKVCGDCYKLEREESFKNSKSVKIFNELAEKNTGEKLENVDWEDVFLLTDDDADWPANTPKGYTKKAFNCGDAEQESAFFGTKVSHYPPCPKPELLTGLRAHTDAGGVILLFQDDKVGGLQVLKDGEWIDVQPLPNAIVINTGDQIEVLSNGRYKSAWHRVLATPDGNRRSLASFYNPSYEATIAPAPELVEKGKPGQAYPRFVFGDYMNVYVEQKFLPKEPRFEAGNRSCFRLLRTSLSKTKLFCFRSLLAWLELQNKQIQVHNVRR